MSTPISELLGRAELDLPHPTVTVEGWIRTSRFGKHLTFVHLYDGSTDETVQIVVKPAVPPALRARLGVGAALRVTGQLVASRGAEQDREIAASPDAITVVGGCDPSTFPVQKKAASPEHWRTIPHLRARTQGFQRLFRARSAVAMAVHTFLQERGFLWVHTPIITHVDCEGAGETFRLDADAFFGRAAHLTVSGQLEAEAFASALGRVYTFGPAFRAEDSHTRRHAAEFWMVEPEIAFADLDAAIALAQALVAHLHDAFAAKERPLSFARITHAEAMALLAASGRRFEHPVGPSEALQTEHERYLTEEHFHGPVFVTHYPIDQKPFYMRVAGDSADLDAAGGTVECFDLLVPGVGEIMGGSAREERLGVLEAQMARCGIDPEAYGWYLDLRRYGSVPHSGFGLGFDRMIMWLTGTASIRDVVPFPRVSG